MLPVRVTPTARRHIERALEWWARNRDKAPTALAEDLEEAIALIANLPRFGATDSSVRYRGARRIALRRVRYHLYYRLVGASPTYVEVLALWHASRAARFVREPMIPYVQPIARAA